MNRRIVDPYEYEHHVSEENKALVRDFLFQKESEGCTAATLKQYRDDMRIINTYLYRHFNNKSLLELSKKEVTQILMIHKKRGVSPNRLVRLLGSLRSCLGVFEDDDDLDHYLVNVAKKVKTPKKYAVKEITFLSDDQINWIKEKLLEKGEILKAVYLMLTYISGKRRGEIHQVLKEGLADRFYTNKVVGKGQKKKFRIFYDEETQGLIRQYLEERGPDDIPYLFVKCYKNGRKQLINPATFNAWCDEFSKILSAREGTIIPINPHCFRHSRIENLDREGVPLKKISKYVNHSSVGTTEMYLAERDEDDAADILGIDITALGGQPKPVTAPIPMMLDRTDRPGQKIQPLTKKPKKRSVKNLSLFLF